MEQIYQNIEDANRGQTEFLQAVREVLDSVRPVIGRHPEYKKQKIFERLAEPDRIIMFRVTWEDDQGNIQINRGYRVQMSQAIGPYKGGMRFHPSVNLSILKFLAFEQVFKNALTTLPLGAAKGGSDFDPKGKSDREVMRFCQRFVQELYRHIGHRTDIPAGDIGVGSREIGYMYGMYKKITNEVTGAFTGKGFEWGGSHIRPEATGYGLIYFTQEMLERKQESLEGKTCLVSGSGNVAQHAAEKLIALGAKVITMSDSDGFILDEEGIDEEKMAFIREIKNVKRERISQYVAKYNRAKYFDRDPSKGTDPMWDIAADCAFPCATQNEICREDAKNLEKNGIMLVAEGANMPCSHGAIEHFRNKGVLYAPGKASNAGGVATSGLEMTQNSLNFQWSAEEMDRRLHHIMREIHKACVDAAEMYGHPEDYQVGANIAGFLKVAKAILAQGLI